MRYQLVLLLVLSSACDELDAPSDLERPQFAAMIAEPPGVAPGGRAQLSALFLGPSGQLNPTMATWVAAAPITGGTAIGTVTQEPGGVFFDAPSTISEPTVAAVQLTADVDGITLVGVKNIAIGVPLSNPVLSAVTVNGEPAPDAAPVSVRPGATLTLSATLAPAPSETGGYAWYTTVGDIEQYLSPTTEMVVDDDGTRTGFIFVVGRDGAGGVASRAVELRVE